MRRPTLLTCALLCCLTSCAWGGFAVEVGRPGDTLAGEDAGATPPVLPWGSYAASLDVPACDPGSEVLVVDTTADTLDGGEAISDPGQAGPELSLMEAFWIGANRQRPQTITFDLQTFPVDTPGRIVLSEQHRFPSRVGQGFPFCLDGRGRGVIIAWPEALRGNCTQCVPNLAQGSRIVGLTLREMPAELQASGGQIAGCRLQATWKAIELFGDALVGPGNVFWGATFAVTIMTPSSSPTVRGNHFGYDPRNGELLDTRGVVMAFDGARIEDNVFAASGTSGPALSTISSDPMDLQLNGNRFGGDLEGAPDDETQAPFEWIQLGSSPWTIGPENRFDLRGSSALRLIDDNLQVELSRNAFVGEGRVFDPSGVAAPIAAPEITGAGPDHVEGHCAVPGRIEVFSDPGALAETYLGEVACDAVSPWRLEAAVPRGRNVTATLTDAQRRSSDLAAPLAVP